MAKNKAYVVWAGNTPGVYNSWAECETQTKGFPGAKFKGFPSRELAETAFSEQAGDYIGKKKVVNSPSGQKAKTFDNKPGGNYLTVDAAYSHKTKVLEWRGVMVENGNENEVFRSNPYRGGSANVGEFLAVIDGLEYLRDNNINLPVYSDSITAQAWVRKKRNNSNVESSPTLIAMLDRADRLLQNGLYDNLKQKITIKDWESKSWGEIPADFQRKTGKGLAVAEGPIL